ncbi:hypothetical protein BUALT_Bualt03G0141800 [Buddleja alternifolia]|uniref:DUF4283 domain-containing protein n=1 Tax=Buddleja alternifolia TaxID=168488 RepID=A0AAV6Y4Y4_9LAMI|nr:hypothetical protein BUALT_Bualt03G0141800 [Buddleja alternifolia]
MKRGLRGLFYSRAEMDEMIAPLKFALVGKFSNGVPTINRVRTRFARFGLKGCYTVGIIDMKHVLINLSSDEDYTRTCMMKEWLIDACKHFGHIKKDCLPIHQGNLDSNLANPFSNQEDLRVILENKKQKGKAAVIPEGSTTHIPVSNQFSELRESSSAQANNKTKNSKAVFRPLPAIVENEGSQSSLEKIDLNK